MKKEQLLKTEESSMAAPNLDNPERVTTDSISLFDMHEDMQTVDTIAISELNKQVLNERARYVTKDPSANSDVHPN
ncbi:hypothetical protein [Paenisporosarcina cavernae]|uniref:Uncharacterized protein n=1 Tax=Paenisporosarcina cavernae TaxID=2320858 RepID=A0A385YUF0_9BACL|nr:hypothetical protein [Paenisporosarcina cavernae]AYC30515.1 hypothetical protein D3873_11980 [Paenisporosarcina cavernae]